MFIYLLFRSKKHNITQYTPNQQNILIIFNLDFDFLLYVFVGENQIIGVADTGLDLQSCYFIDPNEEIPYDTINKNHRKVVTYISYQDMVDDSVNGHGTHVCGSLLGKCIKDYGEYKSYNGVAYNAKIAFYDIGLAGSSTLHPPSNLESGLFGELLLHLLDILYLSDVLYLSDILYLLYILYLLCISYLLCILYLLYILHLLCILYLLDVLYLLDALYLLYIIYLLDLLCL